METFTRQSVLDVLRNGGVAERIALVKALPPSAFKAATLPLMNIDRPEMAVIGITPIIQEYCSGSNPELGAILAEAAHERAVEIKNTVPGHCLMPTTFSALAVNHAKALALLGRSEEVLKTTAIYLNLYADETQNRPSLKLVQIEALLNLGRVDEAYSELLDESLFLDPVSGIEARRLRGRVDALRAKVIEVKSKLKSRPGEIPASPSPLPSMEELLKPVDMSMISSFDHAAASERKEMLEKLDLGRRLDPKKPDDYRALLESLDSAENFLIRGGDNSELSIRQMIRNASAIFVFRTPARSEIEASLESLEKGLQWAKDHGITELQNDALWGMYLCRSRMKQPLEAAYVLIELRGNLELMRCGIADPMKRGGIFSTYPNLFRALCAMLMQTDPNKTGHADDLLEAIESSKGRVIADRLTQQNGKPVDDSAIYKSVKRLPESTRKEGFHYLTFFMDERSVYAALVSKQGTTYALGPIDIGEASAREAAASVNPGRWRKPLTNNAGKMSPDISSLLAPLVSPLDDLFAQGVIKSGDHLCYSPDGSLYNVPLHYLPFRDGLLINYLSISRVHSAYDLTLTLDREASAAPAQFLAVVVPMLQDLKNAEYLTNIEAAPQWLAGHQQDGKMLTLRGATLEALREERLDQKIVHFSTHGSFPWEGNPFHESYLLLSGERDLPDRELIMTTLDGKLTPSIILDQKLDFQGSHVSVMACVGGLASEGIGGDALGLDWAFLHAGASSLISAHWNVSAASTARFFILFYEKWIIRSLSRRRAFRETMLELLAGDNQPESLLRWTAFSLTGDFR